MRNAPRVLSAAALVELLALDVPARLATLDSRGFPHVTPLWFLWSEGAFYFTSLTDRPHLRRLEREPRVRVCVDIESPQRPDGQRPNRQVRALGHAELFSDEGGAWTRAITLKYVKGPAAREHGERRAEQPRVAIRLKPITLLALASV